MEDDVKVLEAHLAQSGVQDEKLLDMARSVFRQAQRNSAARGFLYPEQTQVAARRVTQQVKAIWERESKVRAGLGGA